MHYFRYALLVAWIFELDIFVISILGIHDTFVLLPNFQLATRAPVHYRIETILDTPIVPIQFGRKNKHDFLFQAPPR